MLSRLIGRGLGAAALVALGGGVAHAGVIASGSVGGAPTGVILENFNSVPLGSGSYTTSTGISLVFAPGAQALTGSVSGIAAAPYLSGGNGLGFGPGGTTQADGLDTTTYLATGSTSALPGASVTMNLPAAERYFGMLWGSVDDYNTLSFYSGSTLVASFTGSDIVAAANGDQGVDGTVYVNFNANDGTTFDRVVASSAQYSFEFDNVAFNPTATVPEPLTLSMLATGLLGIGFVRRRRV